MRANTFTIGGVRALSSIRNLRTLAIPKTTLTLLATMRPYWLSALILAPALTSN